VELLGDGEEIGCPVERPPVRLNPHVVHQGNQGVEDLGDAAALGGGVDMKDALALERLRFRDDFAYNFVADYRPVIFKSFHGELNPYVHRLLCC